MSPNLVLNPVCLLFFFLLIETAMKESGVQWSVANEEDHKNGERLVIKHNKVKNDSKSDLLILLVFDWLRYRMQSAPTNQNLFPRIHALLVPS